MSALNAFLQWLYDTSVSTAIRESFYVFPILNTAHVLAIFLLAGTVAVIDLRLLGVTLRNVPISKLSAQLLPISWIGATMLFGTGVLMFSAQSVRIQSSIALRVKFMLLVLAGLNARLWHRELSAHARAWDVGASPHRAQVAGGLSLLLWTGIIVSGRMIAFTAGE